MESKKVDYILILDVGTSSMRGILFDGKGNSLFKKQIPYVARHISAVKIEQPAADWDDACEKILSGAADVLRQKGWKLAAIAITSQRSSLLPVDENGEALMPAIMWQDSRNSQICQRLQENNEEIFQRSGAPVNTIFSGGKMAWIRQEAPEIYAKTKHFLSVPEYILHRLTGEYRTDTTFASRSNLMNIRSKTWDSELCRIFGVPQEMLCEILEPGAVQGGLCQAMAARTGIAEGTPVISAGGDQQCAAIGQGVCRPGVLSITAGTGAFLMTALKEVPQHMENGLICNCSSVAGQYVLEASSMTCCSAFDWFLRNFYQHEEDIYGKVGQVLQTLYGQTENCIALPYFQGRQADDLEDTVRAAFVNLSLSTNRENMLKGLLESICMEIAEQMEKLRQYVQLEAIGISGGLTNNRDINQMQADIYQKRIYHLKNSEATASGAWMVAATGLGWYTSVQEAFEASGLMETAQFYNPNTELAESYQKKRTAMHELYGAVRQWGALQKQEVEQ